MGQYTPDIPADDVGILFGVNDPKPLWGLQSHVEIPCTDPFMKRYELFFKPGFRCFSFAGADLAPCPSETDLGRKIQKQGQIRGEVVQHQAVKGLQKIDVESAGIPLIGQRGIEVAIAQHDFSIGNSRPDHCAQVMGPIGHIEQKLRTGIEIMVFRIEKKRADFQTDGGTARLPGNDYRKISARKVRSR